MAAAAAAVLVITAWCVPAQAKTSKIPKEKLCGRWILTDVEEDDQRFAAGETGMTGELEIEFHNGKPELDSYFYTHEDENVHESADNVPLKVKGETSGQNSAGHGWKAEPSFTLIDTADGPRELREDEKYVITMENENTLRMETTYRRRTYLAHRYLTYHRAGMIGDDAGGWFMPLDFPPVRIKLENAPEDAKVLIIADPQLEGLRMLGHSAGEMKSDYWFLNLTDEELSYYEAPAQGNYDEKQGDFSWQLERPEKLGTIDKGKLAGEDFTVGETIPYNAVIFSMKDSGQKFFWPIAWMSGRQGGACVFLTGGNVSGPKVPYTKMRQAAESVQAGYLYEHPGEEYSTEGFPIRKRPGYEDYGIDD